MPRGSPTAMQPSPRGATGGIAHLLRQFDVPDAEEEDEQSRADGGESAAGGEPAPRSVADSLRRLAADDPELVELDLSDSAIYQTSAAAHTRALAGGLAESTSLSTLRLDGCEIADGDGLALAEALATNAALTELSLRRNILRASTIEAIAESLACNPDSCLRVLELGEQRGGTRIGERVVHAFRRLFETNVTLCRVGGWQLEVHHINQLQPYFGRNNEIARRTALGKRSDELLPDALKSEAQILVEQFDPNDLIDYMDDEDLEIACDEVGLEEKHDGTVDGMRAVLREYYSEGPAAGDHDAAPAQSPEREFIVPARSPAAVVDAPERGSVWVQMGELGVLPTVVCLGVAALLQEVLNGTILEDTLVLAADGRLTDRPPGLDPDEGWQPLEDCPELLDGESSDEEDGDDGDVSELRLPPLLDFPGYDEGDGAGQEGLDEGQEEQQGAREDVPEVWLQSWPEGVPLLDGAERGDDDGPIRVTMEQLLDLITQGGVDDETLVFVEGAEDWQRLEDASAALGFVEEDAAVEYSDEDGYAFIGHEHAPEAGAGLEQEGEEEEEEEVFYSVGGGEAIGVPGASRLAAMIANGSLDPDEALAWKEGMDDWIEVRHFLGAGGPKEG